MSLPDLREKDTGEKAKSWTVMEKSEADLALVYVGIMRTCLVKLARQFIGAQLGERVE